MVSRQEIFPVIEKAGVKVAVDSVYFVPPGIGGDRSGRNFSCSWVGNLDVRSSAQPALANSGGQITSMKKTSTESSLFLRRWLRIA